MNSEDKIPTAEEFLNTEQFWRVRNDFDTQTALIEFAKLHIEKLKDSIHNVGDGIYWLDNHVDEYIEKNIK